ncbi:MAG: ABC transporter permease subunit [Actinomycetota bacterium]
MQPEVYLIGLISGLVVGLIALAIVIVYRANRIINFAAADMGSAPATLAFLCFAAWGWPWWLVSLLGLPLAALLGAVVEFAFLRRFARAPRLIATVATIGVAQIFIFLTILMPSWFPDTDASSFPSLVSGQVTIGDAVFGGADLNVLVVVPLVLVGLVAFFRYSVTGVAIRAAAERADRASLLGIPVRRLQHVVWGLAGLLAYLAIWLRSGYQVQNLGGALDPTLLLTALGAAVIGRMERMPTVVLAAIGLNIVDSAAFTHFSSPAYGAAIRAAIIAVALLVQRADPVGRLAEAATSTWQATQEIRRVPAELGTTGRSGSVTACWRR